jgi:hypothetical protein
MRQRRARHEHRLPSDQVTRNDLADHCRRMAAKVAEWPAWKLAELPHIVAAPVPPQASEKGGAK